MAAGLGFSGLGSLGVQLRRPQRLLTPSQGTGAGRDELLRSLPEPAEPFITEENRWFVLLAFLRHLPDPAAQAAVLRRRLAFLDEPSSYFYDGDTPLRAADVDDPSARACC
ncbi:hypothetical protein ACIRVF_24475 [Kitasatospora sp. NPDC101157]|uniref:hypothetical protein n=1 Tax=Kitasatospora sp. NPDC101157 TaxID=3364098 RepID=UPI00380414E4